MINTNIKVNQNLISEQEEPSSASVIDSPQNNINSKILLIEESDTSSKQAEAQMKYAEISALRDMAKMQKEVSLNAMLCSGGYDTLRHSENYEEACEAFTSFDTMLSDLGKILGSKY